MLLDFLLWSTDNLRPWTGVLSFGGGLLGILGTLYGLLSKRASSRARTASEEAKTSSDETLALVKSLVSLLHAYMAKDEVGTPDKVRDIVRAEVEPQIAPIHDFFAALELAESRRSHRPETDIIRILQEARSAA